MIITEKKLRLIIREELLVEQSYDAYTHDQIISSVNRALEILNINNSTLRTFMIRIARQESGGNPAGEEGITGYDSNPFQLDEPSIVEVKTNINMGKWRRFINNKEGQKPANLSQLVEDQDSSAIRDSSTLSALYATLYILWRMKAWKPGTEINPPSNLKSQADFWKKWYNTSAGKGRACEFIEKNGGSPCPS